MSKLNDAVARLGAAIERLETIADARLADADADVSPFRAEREQLLIRIAALEEESRVLASVTGEVEGRLEGAIAELRGALGQH